MRQGRTVGRAQAVGDAVTRRAVQVAGAAALAGALIGTALAAGAAKPAPTEAAEVVSTLPGASSSRPGEQRLSTAAQRQAGEARLARELARRRELDELAARPQPPMVVVVDPRERDRSRERPPAHRNTPGAGTP
ncbi:hypothetical protein [Derxia lacustris]|uniref:hypothetical protein n=1 Tax=Derxia lacustris TaxID=764842 RepID=UPI000A176731|nr:hypothetical protein [Derxia lacustris]